MICLSCSAIYERMKPKSASYDPSFPKPIKLGTGKNPPVAWIESEIEAWLESKITNSRPTVETMAIALLPVSGKPRSAKNHAG
jgi:predicted DNA-binding transcriptional regulator AlpA